MLTISIVANLFALMMQYYLYLCQEKIFSMKKIKLQIITYT